MAWYDDPSSESYTGAQQPGQVGESPYPGWEWDPRQNTWVPAASVIDAPQGQAITGADPSTPSDLGNDTRNYPAPDSGIGGGTIGGLLAPFSGTFTPPPTPFPGATGTGVPETPVFNAPGYTKPPAFSYDPYHLPTAEEAQNEPGFQFGLGQSLKALQQRASARGSLNTGGTIKGMIDYARNAADQQYSQVADRSLQIYNTNRNNAADIYATNAQTQYLQPYQFAYQSALDSFAPQMQGYSTNAQANQRGNELSYSNAWDRYLQGYNQFRDQRDSTFDKTFKYLTA